MTLSPERRAAALAGALLLLWPWVQGCYAAPDRYRRVEEKRLRSSAVRTLLPAYPKRSLASRAEGVAVADLELAEDGSVRSVTVLESPDSEIAREISSVLKQWKFAVPVPQGVEHIAVRGKVTHYFVIEAGNGRVLTPVEETARRRRIAREGA